MPPTSHPTDDSPTPTANTGVGGLEPDPRVLFAAERTLLAWIRTGLSLMGFGFVVARFGLFLRQIAAAGLAQVSVKTEGGATVTPLFNPAVNRSQGYSLWVGIVLVLLGVAAIAVAVRQHFFVLRRLNRGESLFPAPPSSGVFIGGALVVLGVVIAMSLFIIGR